MIETDKKNDKGSKVPGSVLQFDRNNRVSLVTPDAISVSYCFGFVSGCHSRQVPHFAQTTHKKTHKKKGLDS